jgi:hypothetical protein
MISAAHPGEKLPGNHSYNRHNTWAHSTYTFQYTLYTVSSDSKHTCSIYKWILFYHKSLHKSSLSVLGLNDRLFRMCANGFRSFVTLKYKFFCWFH